jgi:hypothetical protein
MAGYPRLMGADAEGIRERPYERPKVRLQRLINPKVAEHRGNPGATVRWSMDCRFSAARRPGMTALGAFWYTASSR